MICFLRRFFNNHSAFCFWVYQTSTLEKMTQMQGQEFLIEVAKTKGVIGVLGRIDYLQKILKLVDNTLSLITPKKWHYIYHFIYKKQ